MINIYTDGACRVSNPGMCSCAFVALTEKGELIHQQGFYLGPENHTNNYAEYMGVIHALEWVADAYPPETVVLIHCDSLLVVNQVTGGWKCNKPDLIPLLEKVSLLSDGKPIGFTHVKGHSGVPGNELADKMCNEVLDKERMSIKTKLREAIEKIVETPCTYTTEYPSTSTYAGRSGPFDSSVYTVPSFTASTSGVSGTWPYPATEYSGLSRSEPKTAQEVWDNLENEASEKYYLKTGKSFGSLSPCHRRTLIEIELERHQKGTSETI